MKAFLDAALDKQKLILLTLGLIFVAGCITYVGMPKESNPDVPIPYLYVTLALEGVSPEDAERLLVRPVETALRSIEGVKKIQSRAYPGLGTVALEFDAGFDNQKALREVRRKVDEVRSKLPQEMDEPEVLEDNAGLDPVLLVDLSGPVPERSLVAIARQLRDDLGSIKGVLKVDINGDREEMVEIQVDPLKMDAYGISQEELFNLFVRNNRLIAAGVLDTGNGRFAVKLPGVIENVADVQGLPVKVNGDRVVKFSDIATITRAFKDPATFARRNGERSITLEVVKRLGENVIETVDRVKHSVAEHQKYWPASVAVDYAYDSSKDIHDMLNDLQNGVLTAVILVVCVLIGFLGWRTASLVAIAVPGSFLMGILALSMLGLTINIVVLFSLIMAVGMLVDDAIVVGEYADRKMCEGLPASQAYRASVKRMAWPIISSTATRLAAFVPLLFWPGMMGGFMKFLPITLIATLTASLVMALIFIPTIGAMWGSANAHSKDEQRRIAAAETGNLSELRGGSALYLRALTWAVDHPRKTFVVAVLMLVTIFGAYNFFGAGVELFPQGDPEGSRMYIHARGDLSVYEKDKLVREVESRILDVADLESANTKAGAAGRDSPDTIGYIRLRFKDWQLRRKSEDIIEDLRARTANMPGVLIEIEVPRNGPSQGKPVSLQLSSTNAESLEESNRRLGGAVAAIRDAMKQVGGFTDIEDTRPLDGLEWHLNVNRAEAAKYGADIVLIGNAVQLITNGVLLGKYRPDDAADEIDIRARYTAAYRNLDQLANLKLQTRDGLVPIANFVERHAAPRVNSILRIGGKRVMTIDANVAKGMLADTQVKALQKYLEQHPAAALADGSVHVGFTGEQEDQAESQAFLLNAFGLAIFMMLAILVTQFNSFYQTALVLSAVLFSTAAVFLGLMVLHKPFGIVMGGVGVIALAGVIVNNNIILIDTYNHLRHDDHLGPREALLRTGAMRLRPVLLTAGTAILGLLPMAFGVNPDIIHRLVTVGAPSSQFWIQLASAIAGGLAFATPITLILTPALLMWKELRKAKVAAPVTSRGDTLPSAAYAPK